MTRIARIKGLFLWKVPVNYQNGFSRAHENLLITTRTHSVRKALEKAEAIMRRRDELDWKINGANYEGTLDA